MQPVLCRTLSSPLLSPLLLATLPHEQAELMPELVRIKKEKKKGGGDNKRKR